LNWDTLLFVKGNPHIINNITAQGSLEVPDGIELMCGCPSTTTAAPTIPIVVALTIAFYHLPFQHGIQERFLREQFNELYSMNPAKVFDLIPNPIDTVELHPRIVEHHIVKRILVPWF
jgi:hypothetical protein